MIISSCLPRCRGKGSLGPLCHRLPLWYHRGVPTLTVFCPVVPVPPCVPSLSVQHPCGSQKLRILPVFLTLPWASRNPEGLSEALHLPHHTGLFLGLIPGKTGTGPLWPQFPKPSWGGIIPPPDVTQGCKGPGALVRDPLLPSLQPPLWDCFSLFACFHSFFHSSCVLSALSSPLEPSF